MTRNSHKSMDPSEIESRFSNEKSFFYDQEEKISISYDDFRPFIDKLPKREVDLIDMYYTSKKKQKEIAQFFGVTQGAISHRLSRACKRLKFLRDMPKINGDIENILKDYFESFEIDLIMLMISTTCQSKSAEILNKKYNLKGSERMTQVKVRHKFGRYYNKINRLKSQNKDLEVCGKLMEYIKKNLYMMHEVVLPHFDRGYKVEYEDIF